VRSDSLHRQNVQPELFYTPNSYALIGRQLLRCQAVETAWMSTASGSLLPRCLARIVEILGPLSLSWAEPTAQTHHVASAVIFAMCLPREPRYIIPRNPLPILYSLPSAHMNNASEQAKEEEIIRRICLLKKSLR
jgi:hypothetical protein